MKSYNKEFNNSGNEREREGFSSFVVDLRSLAKQKEDDSISQKNNKKIEKTYLFKKISQNFIDSFKNLKTKQRNKRKISFNFSKFSEALSFKKKKRNFSLSKNLLNILIFNRRHSEKSNLFKSNAKNKTKLFKNNFWRQAVKEKSKILNTKFYSQKKKLHRSEQKVIWYRSLFSFN
ncbi:MAG: hypothetical protein ACOCWG_04340 [bacterium]